MLKRLPILLGLVIICNVPLAAQNTHIELTYQSFRPFIHFQLEVNNYRRNYNPYESAYLNGYMDGVNDEYYFSNLTRDIRAYKTGYRDGFRDRSLLIRLRGRRWYMRHRFAYDDYYAPTYAVRIWLNNLSLAFLRAPDRRLPRGWRRRAHPHLKHYRKWMRKEWHHKNHSTYYSSTNVERRYEKRIRGYRHKLNKAKKRSRRNDSYDRNQFERKRFRQRIDSKASHSSRINRRTKGHTRIVKKRTSHNRKVNRDHNRGRIHKKRKSDSHKSKRHRSRNRGHGNNH